MHSRITSTTVVLAAIIATLAVAAAASAGPVTLWACHGPAGQPLGSAGLTTVTAGDGITQPYGVGCGAAAPTVADGGLEATFAQPDPSGASAAGWRLRVPVATTLTSAQVTRDTLALGPTVSGDPLGYRTQTPTATLEALSLAGGGSALDGDFSSAATGDSVTAGVSCDLAADETCAASPSGTVGVEVSRMAITVDDTSAPAGAVGGLQSPASGTLTLHVTGSDTGLGLSDVELVIDGQPLSTTALGGAACADLSPLDPAIDLPVAAGCPAVVSDQAIGWDTTAVPDGDHHIQVVLVDAAGNATAIADRSIHVDNTPVTQTSSVSVGIGSGAQSGAGSGSGSGGSSGGVSGAGGTASPCPKPILSMMLSQAPLRTSHGVPVLHIHTRYRFSGRLTCLVGGRRVGAPAGTVVQVLNVVKGGLFGKSGTTTRSNGGLTIILAYASSRTIEFRYLGSDGGASRVRIPIEIVRAHHPKKAKRKPRAHQAPGVSVGGGVASYLALSLTARTSAVAATITATDPDATLSVGDTVLGTYSGPVTGAATTVHAPSGRPIVITAGAQSP